MTARTLGRLGPDGHSVRVSDNWHQCPAGADAKAPRMTMDLILWRHAEAEMFAAEGRRPAAP